MSFTAQIAAADSRILSLFGLPLTIHYQSGSPDLTINAITKNPAFEEDYTPGSAGGVTYLLLFIRIPTTGVIPTHGDTGSYGGIDYDIFKVDADREGGYSLRLRRRANARTV